MAKTSGQHEDFSQNPHKPKDSHILSNFSNLHILTHADGVLTDTRQPVPSFPLTPNSFKHWTGSGQEEPLGYKEHLNLVEGWALR